MRLRGRDLIDESKTRYNDCVNALDRWVNLVVATNWSNSNELRQTFNDARYVQELNGYTFKIRGNRYRLLAQIDFEDHIVTVTRFGTHEEYDKW